MCVCVCVLPLILCIRLVWLVYSKEFHWTLLQSEHVTVSCCILVYLWQTYSHVHISISLSLTTHTHTHTRTHTHTHTHTHIHTHTHTHTITQSHTHTHTPKEPAPRCLRVLGRHTVWVCSEDPCRGRVYTLSLICLSSITPSSPQPHVVRLQPVDQLVVVPAPQVLLTTQMSCQFSIALATPCRKLQTN